MAILAQAQEQAANPCLQSDAVFSLTRLDDGAVTICGQYAHEDCEHDRYLQAYDYGRPDLNGDGVADYLIRTFSGLHGIDHNLSYFSAYLACGSGQLREVAFGAFTAIRMAAAEREGGFAVLKVTRECRSDDLTIEVRREYTLRFNTRSRRYGPPDDIDALNDYCGAYEQSLPGEHIGP